jgi:CRP-like cAMP-binding protein
MSFSRASLARIAPELQQRAVRVRDRVIDPEEDINEVFFPVDCVLSTVAQDANGEAVEVATIGNEGMAGIGVFLGVNSTPTLETFTQVPGSLLVMRARDFRDHLKMSAGLSQIMGLYTQALLTQISQSSACNRMHPAQERCARWLLMTHDRVRRDEFELTHQFLAQMLGVRRATVSEIAGGLQEARVIRYVRGVITVTDRAGLEDHSCECYRIIRDEYLRLLGPTRGGRPHAVRSGEEGSGGSAPD